MKPEPLNGKRIGIASGSSRFVDFDESSGFWFGDVKSACEFYLKYFYNPWELWNEQPICRCKKLNEFIKNINENSEGFSDIPETTMMKYNEWLFKLAFKDVLGDNQ